MLAPLLVASLINTAAPEDDLIRAVVARLETNQRKLIPDAGLLPKSGPLPLRQDALNPSLFSPSKWTLKSAAAWQAEADQAKANRYVVTIRPGEREGDTVTVTVGVELILPTGTNGVVLCCCNTMDVYRRDGKKWRFEKTTGTICS